MVARHRTWRWLGGFVGLLAAVGLVSCGGASGGSFRPSSAKAPPPSTDSARVESTIQSGAAPAGESMPTPSPAAMSAESVSGGPRKSSDQARRSERESAPSTPAERPGLGTEWGETRTSQIHERRFERDTPSRPNGVVALYYNDREGARAMTRHSDYRESGYASVNVPGLDVAVSVRDEYGASLSAFFANGNTYAIGEAGRNYKIVIRNDMEFQVEAVASVDGLDVIDGRSASYTKRGYLVPPHGNIEIEGFRRSDTEVAAFRFGSVRDSYAARTGSDRNVGVIGLAVFVPRGAVWTNREIQRRKNADPFPSKYATPPPGH